MEYPCRHGRGVVKLLNFLSDSGATHEAIFFIVLLVLLLCRGSQIGVLSAIESICLLGSHCFPTVMLCFVTGGKTRLVVLGCLL